MPKEDTSTLLSPSPIRTYNDVSRIESDYKNLRVFNKKGFTQIFKIAINIIILSLKKDTKCTRHIM